MNESVPEPETVEGAELSQLQTEEEVTVKMKHSRKKTVENFARTLLKVLKKYSTQQEIDYGEFLGEEERMEVHIDYPLYQQRQACYAINRLIETTGKVIKKTAYSDGEPTNPKFSDVELKRDYYEMLLVQGKIFFKWKRMKAVASLLFVGNYSEASFLYRKKDLKLMKEFQKKLREFMIKHNFFKGEKLEYLRYSHLQFLKYPKKDWNSLILKKELKEEIDLNLLFPLYNEKLCKKHQIPWRRGVLLAGLPGTGKTELGRVLCNVLDGITVIWATCKAVDGATRVKILFRIARDFAPTLIVFEDIDFFGHDREFGVSPVVGELLNQLDGGTPNEGVFVLATTNRPYLLDKALADRPSRFDVKLVFDVPDLEERKEMVNLFSKGKVLEVEKNYIASITGKLTGAHIKEIINYSALLALKKGEKAIKKKHINQALKRIKEKLVKHAYKDVS